MPLNLEFKALDFLHHPSHLQSSLLSVRSLSLSSPLNPFAWLFCFPIIVTLMGHCFAEYASYAKDHHRHQQVSADPGLDIDVSCHLSAFMLCPHRNEDPHDQNPEDR
jgi:hypothetical protein